MSVYETKSENVPLYLEFVGGTSGFKDIAIRARVEGFLEKIHFKEGAPVKKGELLYTLESQIFDEKVSARMSAVAEAKTMLAKARGDLDRIKPLAEINAVSQSDLDESVATYAAALSSVEAAEANLRAAEIERSYTKIRSPIDGIIGKTAAKVGDLVGRNADTAILNTVSRIDTILVTFFITERQYLTIARDLKRLRDQDRYRKAVEIELILVDGSTYGYKGKVDFIGASDYSMRIWIKPDRLAHLGISVPEIVAAIRAQSVVVPGGKFGAEPAPPGNEFTYTVRMPDRLQNEKEFGEIVVRTAADGSQVKIKNIARVELGVETYNAFTRLNGKPCAMIALYQAPGSNAVTLAEQVRETMKEMAATFPKSMTYDISLDTTKAITAGISEIVTTLVIALLLVILVVYIFIQDWRAALIPTIAIPVSLIGAFIVFPLIGFTVNVLSLLGLVLAIGIVVDDAIVVVEAVQVNIEKGMEPKAATKAAMEVVTAPVIATTLVLVAVFIPVAAMGGDNRAALQGVYPG